VATPSCYFTGFCHLPYDNPGPQSLSSRRKPEALTSIPLTMAQMTGPPTQSDKLYARVKPPPTQLPAAFGLFPGTQRQPEIPGGSGGVLWSPTPLSGNIKFPEGTSEPFLPGILAKMVGLGG